MASGPHRVEVSDLATGAVDAIGDAEDLVDQAVKLKATNFRADEHENVAGSIVLR